MIGDSWSKANTVYKMWKAAGRSSRPCWTLDKLWDIAAEDVIQQIQASRLLGRRENDDMRFFLDKR